MSYPRTPRQGVVRLGYCLSELRQGFRILRFQNRIPAEHGKQIYSPGPLILILGTLTDPNPWGHSGGLHSGQMWKLDLVPCKVSRLWTDPYSAHTPSCVYSAKPFHHSEPRFPQLLNRTGSSLGCCNGRRGNDRAE